MSLKILIIGLVLMLIFFNVYFRMKILKIYKKLVQNRVEFTAGQLLNKDRREQEIIKKYPGQRAEIEDLAEAISFSFKVAVSILGLLLLISFGVRFL